MDFPGWSVNPSWAVIKVVPSGRAEQNSINGKLQFPHLVKRGTLLLGALRKWKREASVRKSSFFHKYPTFLSVSSTSDYFHRFCISSWQKKKSLKNEAWWKQSSSNQSVPNLERDWTDMKTLLWWALNIFSSWGTLAKIRFQSSFSPDWNPAIIRFHMRWSNGHDMSVHHIYSIGIRIKTLRSQK